MCIVINSVCIDCRKDKDIYIAQLTNIVRDLIVNGELCIVKVYNCI